jgi:hypothetical protein
LVIESLKIFGQDVYYIPRTLVERDTILNEDPASSFDDAYLIEAYIENQDGFEGAGDLYQKFGLEIRDEATFIISKRQWERLIGLYNNTLENVHKPKEGDIIFLPLSNSFFEITFVEHEQPFYQLSNLPVYKLTCSLFEYSDEDLDTGLNTIDGIEQDHAYEFDLTLSGVTGDFEVGERVRQTTASGVILSGEVSSWVSSTNALSIIHFGGNDGKFHLPVTTLTVTGDDTNAVGTLTSFVEDNKLSENEQNTTFDTVGAGFLDFSESNPFGDPS